MTRSASTPRQRLPSLWKLGGLSWKQLGRRVWSEMDEDDIFNRANQLAYSFLLALFPLLLFLITLFGLFASYGPELRADLFSFFQQVLPPGAFRLVGRTLNEVAEEAGAGKLSFGLLFAVYVGSGGIMQLINSLNKAYDVKDSRSWIKVRVIAIALTVGISVCVIFGLLMIMFGGRFAELAGAKIGFEPAAVTMWKLFQYAFAIALILLAYSAIYYFGPDIRNRRWHWITPGSAIGMTIWIAASLGFRLYLQFFNRYTRTYGSLGSVIVLLVWFYVSGLSFLIGGEVNAVIEHAALRDHPEEITSEQQAG